VKTRETVFFGFVIANHVIHGIMLCVKEINQMSRKPRLYIDTSAVGGVFDDFAKFNGCKEFFDLVQDGKYIVLISDITISELARAPRYVQDVLDGLPKECIEFCFVDEEAKSLAQKYIEAGILTDKDINDAEHVALATIHNVNCIVSCNFKHLVKASKIAQFNSVNMLNNYGMIDIRRPGDLL
jgi:predicted nucleic acid-binding protein